MTKRFITVALAGALSALLMAFVAVAQLGHVAPARSDATIAGSGVTAGDVTERPCSAIGHDRGRSRHKCHHLARQAFAGPLSRPARKIALLPGSAAPSIAALRLSDAGPRLAPPSPAGQRLASAAGFGAMYAVTRRLHI